MAGKLSLKMATVVAVGFDVAFNKLTAYPPKSVIEAVRLSQAKRVVTDAICKYRADVKSMLTRLGTDEGDKGFKIPAEMRSQFDNELAKLGEREIKLPMTQRVKLLVSEVPERYFTPDDFFHLEPLVEIIEANKTRDTKE